MTLGSVRILVVIVTAAVVGGIAGSVVTATSNQNNPNEKVIKATTFVMTDEHGKELAILGSNKAGTYFLLRSKDGSHAIYLGAETDNAGVLMRNNSGRKMLKMSVKDFGDDTQIQMIGTHCKLTAGSHLAKELITLFTGAEESAGLAFQDRKGVYRLSAGLGEDSPYFYMRSEKNKRVYRVDERLGVLQVEMKSPDKKITINSNDIIDSYTGLRKRK